MSLQESRGSYEYRAVCAVCRDKSWASELKLRWDQLWTCKQCWEPRHPSDFYRNRSDVHKLPFIQPGDDAELTFPNQNTSILSSNVLTTDEALNVSSGSYLVNTLTGKTKFTQLAFYFTKGTGGLGVSGNTPILGRSKVIHSARIFPNQNWALPTTPGLSLTVGVVCGQAFWMSSDGFLLASAPLLAGSNVVDITTGLGTGPWTSKTGHITFSGSYTT